jgi:hypothetical protein
MTTDNTEKKAILDGLMDLFSRNRRWLLFFGTGTSCALDPRFGMPALATHLEKELGDADDWAQVKEKLTAGLSLEQALTEIGLSQDTKTGIQRETGKFVADVDRSVRNDVLLGKEHWVGERIIKALTHRLPPRNPRLPVVTSNYDMLIEYACAAQGIRYTTGFLGEVIRVWNWEGVRDSLNQSRVSRNGSRTMTLMDPLARIELFKVHGSINRFQRNNEQVECDLWIDEAPNNCNRVIAAPGEQKYEQYAGNIDTAALAKQAEREAMAFAVIGYGFNDDHLHQHILDRVQQQQCPLLVLTLDLDSAQIEKLQALGKGVWILIAPKLATGKNDEACTAVYMPERKDPIILEGSQLWNCDFFAKEILGG